MEQFGLTLLQRALVKIYLCTDFYGYALHMQELFFFLPFSVYELCRLMFITLLRGKKN